MLANLPPMPAAIYGMTTAFMGIALHLVSGEIMSLFYASPREKERFLLLGLHHGRLVRLFPYHWVYLATADTGLTLGFEHCIHPVWLVYDGHWAELCVRFEVTPCQSQIQASWLSGDDHCKIDSDRDPAMGHHLGVDRYLAECY